MTSSRSLVDGAASSGLGPSLTEPANQVSVKGSLQGGRLPSTLNVERAGLPAWVVVRLAAGVAEVVVVERLSQLRSSTPSVGVRVPVAAVHCDPELFLQVAKLTGPYPVSLPVDVAAGLFGRMQLAPELLPHLLRVCRKHPEVMTVLVGWHQAVVDAA